ncbi:hypothetical protein ARMSODRAFT_565415 [Armillaria solidipes]|uniref:Uncharacterized protein n=1 Tax=Armillaria solidipes TaxID=1076256 RepID=A0A2H3BST1_9AGAR|nr:hypothetical protein ARMSODRAFT_565415 [Armillaria solidipes]
MRANIEYTMSERSRTRALATRGPLFRDNLESPSCLLLVIQFTWASCHQLFIKLENNKWKPVCSQLIFLKEARNREKRL